MTETIQSSDTRTQTNRGLIHRIETTNKVHESCQKKTYQEEVEPKRPYIQLYTYVRERGIEREKEREREKKSEKEGERGREGERVCVCVFLI